MGGALVFDISGIVTALDGIIRATTGFLVGVFIMIVGSRYVLGRHGGHSFVTSGPLGRVYQRLASEIEG